MHVSILKSFGGNQQLSLCCGSHSNWLGHGPQQGPPCAGDGDDDLMGMFAFRHQVALPCAEPDVGLPTEGLDRGGELLQT